MNQFDQAPIPYDSQWPIQFSVEAIRLQKVFGHSLSSLHHIGSTSIPGLIAKPILDMVGETSRTGEMNEFIDALTTLGFEYRGEYGIKDRDFFVRKNDPAVHLHLFPVGHFQIEKHIIFRDYLIAHPEVARKYGKKKSELLTTFPLDRDSYQAGKDDLIKEITESAYAWTGKTI